MAKPKREEKELTEEEIGQPVEVEVKRPLDKIVPIRLSAEHWSELYRYARELGIGPTTLARMWILEKLALIRAAAPVVYAPGAVPLVQSWLAPTPLRLTFDQFMEKLVSSLPDDLKQNALEFVKQSMMPPDAEAPEDVRALLMTWGAATEMGKLMFQAIARNMGIEIVEEEAEVKEPKG
ncbi:MAG: hypothetical protein IBX36_03415 [Dehalococcoidia bacterium]|nr:hypothetical protein [Dehalococcoidia bacterium]